MFALFFQVPDSVVVKLGLLLTDPRVDGLNPGRANQINRVSKSVVTARASRWSTITQYHRHGYLPS